MPKVIKLNKPNGHVIPCLIDCPKSFSQIVIMVHGMCSCKESDTVRYLMPYFVERGFAVIAYDHPGHGKEEAAKEELTIRACFESLLTVEHYLASHLPGTECCYFGSSFGAYTLLNYFRMQGRENFSACFRCAAVNFPKLVLGSEGTDDTAESNSSAERLEQARKEGFLRLEIDGQPVKFSFDFLDELTRFDLMDESKLIPEHAKEHCIFVHGTEDTVVPIQAVREFTSMNEVRLIEFEGEGHTLRANPETQRRIGDIAWRLFQK